VYQFSAPDGQTGTPSLTTRQKFELILSVLCPVHDVKPGTRCPTELGTCSARSRSAFPGDEQ
jgi:hypothetical protein